MLQFNQFKDGMCLFTPKIYKWSEVGAVDHGHLLVQLQAEPTMCSDYGLWPDKDGDSAAAKVEADKPGGLESYVGHADQEHLARANKVCKFLLQISAKIPCIF